MSDSGWILGGPGDHGGESQNYKKEKDFQEIQEVLQQDEGSRWKEDCNPKT